MAQVIKKVAEDITQPVTTYIRNRNNPDSKIAYRPINPSSKVLLKNRPKCLLSCDTEAYFQGGHCRQVLCAAAARPHGGLCTRGREDGDKPHRPCSQDLQQELGVSRVNFREPQSSTKHQETQATQLHPK